MIFVRLLKASVFTVARGAVGVAGGLALFAAVESQIYAGPDARGPDDLT